MDSSFYGIILGVAGLIIAFAVMLSENKSQLIQKANEIGTSYQQQVLDNVKNIDTFNID